MEGYCGLVKRLLHQLLYLVPVIEGLDIALLELVEFGGQRLRNGGIGQFLQPFRVIMMNFRHAPLD